MEELFKFAHYVEAITEAHVNGSIEAERTNGAKGLQWIEAVCVPDYDPATGGAVESRTFAELVRQHATTPGGEYAFIEAVERHAHAIMAEADKYLTTADENTPQGKYMKHCFDIAENIVWEAVEANERFSIQPADDTTGTQATQGRGCLLNRCNLKQETKKQLFDELVNAGVFSSRNKQKDLATFNAFVFGDHGATASDFLTADSRDKLHAFVDALTTVIKRVSNTSARSGFWLTTAAWAKKSNGTKYNPTSLRQPTRDDFQEVAAKQGTADLIGAVSND